MMWRTLWRRLSAESGFWNTICNIPQVGPISPCGDGSDALPPDLDDGAIVGGGETHQHPGECRLAAPRLAHHAQSLPRVQLEVDVDEGAHGVAAAGVGLGDVFQPDHWRCQGRPGRRGDFGRRPAWQCASLLVLEASRRTLPAEGYQGRNLGTAMVVGECTPSSKDATGLHLTRRGQEAGDRLQAVPVLAMHLPGQAAQKSDRVRVTGVVEDLVGWPLLHDLARVNDAHPVAHLGNHRQVMTDEQDRSLELLSQLRNQVENFGFDGRVQGGSRLIEDQQCRLDGDGHRDDNSLQHAA